MTIGEQIVFIHFGESARLFSDLARDIDAALADKDRVVKSVSEDCAYKQNTINLMQLDYDRMRRELDDRDGVIR